MPRVRRGCVTPSKNANATDGLLLRVGQQFCQDRRGFERSRRCGSHADDTFAWHRGMQVSRSGSSLSHGPTNT